MQTLALTHKAALKSISTSNDEIAPGLHHVDFMVRVHGTVKKGNEYMSNIVANAKPWEILALALSKLNSQTARSIGDLVTDLVRECDGVNPGMGEEVKGYADIAIQKIKNSTTKICSGKTVCSVDFDVIPIESLVK